MNKFKTLVLALVLSLGTVFLGFASKANAAYDDGNYRYQRWNYNMPWHHNYDNYMNRYYPNYYQYHYYNQAATYPRTVYLVDAGNSANQLNIINATRGGSTTAAYVTVAPQVYNRVVNDYNRLGIVSVRVDRASNIVTFYTVSGTYSANIINIDWQ